MQEFKREACADFHLSHLKETARHAPGCESMIGGAWRQYVPQFTLVREFLQKIAKPIGRFH
ncbi:hypothetical protein BDI4_510034 [Burkholderia diffusa]|nr:hypothetical protein BDI4_510034 [Burkholderia diffusa]